MAKPLKPWPTEAGSAYQKLIELHEAIAALVTVSIEEGIEERNKFVLEELLTPITNRTKEFRQHCRAICALLDESQSGRKPKWYKVVTEMKDRADDILELTRDIRPALKRNELIYLRDVYDCLKVEIERIEKLLEKHPYRPGLEAWEEAADIVNAKMKR